MENAKKANVNTSSVVYKYSQNVALVALSDKRSLVDHEELCLVLARCRRFRSLGVYTVASGGEHGGC